METGVQDRADRNLHALRNGAERWIRTGPGQRAELLAALMTRVHTIAPRWVRAAAETKGIGGTPLEGEEWISGPWALLYALNRYIRTLREIERFGAPRLDPDRVRTRPDGQVTVDVYPNDLYDRMLLMGTRVEVWMRLGVTAASLPETMAVWYRERVHQPRVALVLGAGNIASIAPLDVLYKLIADGAVCLLKLNPVNEYLGPFLEEIFAPLSERGFLRFAYGGAEVGGYLCGHRAIDEIHVTGSEATFEAIASGEGRGKPLTGELGNVTPTIVVPGPWSAKELRFQAESIVTQKLHNAGCNCVAAQVLVLPSAWNGTQPLIEAVEHLMQTLPMRPEYYPGTAARTARLTQQTHGTTRICARDAEGLALRTIVTYTDTAADDALFSEEIFGSTLAVVQIPGDPERYMERAVSFANERLRGTLGAQLIVHSAAMRALRESVEDAIAQLRYGCIGVNAWTGVGYFITETPWGAYSGENQRRIESGVGVVHNSRLFSRSQKSVVYSPFVPFPKPPWFVTNDAAATIGKALCDFEVNKNPFTAATVAMNAIRG
jgi:aldehyde dehydrogenase (NAD(P)+)